MRGWYSIGISLSEADRAGARRRVHGLKQGDFVPGWIELRNSSRAGERANHREDRLFEARELILVTLFFRAFVVGCCPGADLTSLDFFDDAPFLNAVSFERRAMS